MFKTPRTIMAAAIALGTTLFAASSAQAVDGYHVLWQADLAFHWDWLPTGHIGDFDGDGRLEIAADAGGGTLEIRDALTGELEAEFNGQSIGHIVVVDLDLDGTPEIIADVGYWNWVIDFGTLPV